MNTQIKQLRAENNVILDPNSDVELLSTIPLFKDWVKNLLSQKLKTCEFFDSKIRIVEVTTFAMQPWSTLAS